MEVDSDEEDGEPVIPCAMLLRCPKTTQMLHSNEKGTVYEFDPGARNKTYARLKAGEYAPWGYEVSSLWEVPGTSQVLRPRTPAEDRLAKRGGCLFGFDWQAAEADVARALSQVEGAGEEGRADLAERASTWLRECAIEESAPEDQPAERSAATRSKRPPKPNAAPRHTAKRVGGGEARQVRKLRWSPRQDRMHEASGCAVGSAMP